jgi:hypothetical protein
MTGKRTLFCDAMAAKVESVRSLRWWERLCDEIEANASYTQKTVICSRHFASLRQEAPELLYTCVKLLLAKEDARVYRLRDKQWIKLLSSLLHQDDADMLEHLNLGDVSETARVVRHAATPQIAKRVASCNLTPSALLALVL